MRQTLLSAVALGTLATAALAQEPVTLTDDQMDKVTAGAVAPRPNISASHLAFLATHDAGLISTAARFGDISVMAKVSDGDPF